jgi:DNA-binding Xre family transcriptional regulator
LSFRRNPTLREAHEQVASLTEDLQAEREQVVKRRAELDQCKSELVADHGKLVGLLDELDRTRAQLVQVHEICMETCSDLEARNLRIEELQHQCKQLECEQIELLRLRREQDQVSQREQEPEEALRRAEQKLSKSKLNHEAQVAEFESRIQSYERKNEDLLRRWRQSRTEAQLQGRSRVGLMKREEKWEQTQSHFLARIDDLRDALSEEAQHTDNLSGQLERAEERSRSLEELLRRHAPGELLLLDGRGATRTVSRETIEAQLRAENRHLQAQISEQRLRGADETKRLAQTSAKLRQLERCVEEGQLQEFTHAPALAALPPSTPSLALEAPAGRTTGAYPEGRIALRELPAESADSNAGTGNGGLVRNVGFAPGTPETHKVCADDRSADCTGSDRGTKTMDVPMPPKGRMPRNSILKKPPQKQDESAAGNGVGSTGTLDSIRKEPYNHPALLTIVSFADHGAWTHSASLSI